MNTAICYFLIYFSEALICIQYTSNVFSCVHSKIKTYSSLAVLYIALFLISFLYNPYINSLMFFFFNAAFFYFLIHTTRLNAIFHSIILTVIMLLCELLVLAFFSKISLKFYADINQYENVFIISFFSKLLYFVITYIISHIISKKKSNDNISIIELLFLCAIPILSLWITLTFITLCLSTQFERSIDVMIILSTFFILLINIFIFGLYENIKQKNAKMAELKLQSQRECDYAEYYKMLMQQDQNQKILIHDIKKHLQAISALNKQHDSAKIDSYLERVLGSSELQHSVRVCDNELLNAILCRYQKLCLTKNIKLELDIRSKCIDFITEDDLSVLFGNLMDNAVESAEKTVTPLIELNVFKKEEAPMTVITMLNSCRHDPFDKNGILRLTKKPNPQFHGLGMRSIENIVKKYDGHMKIYFDNPTKTFHTIIVLRHR